MNKEMSKELLERIKPIIDKDVDLSQAYIAEIHTAMFASGEDTHYNNTFYIHINDEVNMVFQCHNLEYSLDNTFIGTITECSQMFASMTKFFLAKSEVESAFEDMLYMNKSNSSYKANLKRYFDVLKKELIKTHV